VWSIYSRPNNCHQMTARMQWNLVNQMTTFNVDRVDELRFMLWQVTNWQYDFTSLFLQRVSIACYAERCISYSKSVRLSVRPSVTRWHWVKTTQATIMGFSLEDRPRTLVSSCLTSPQNSKGNMGSEGAEWETGRKNRQFLLLARYVPNVAKEDYMRSV